MMPNDRTGGTTLLDRLVESLTSAANISRASQARPAAVVWTGQDGLWGRRRDACERCCLTSSPLATIGWMRPKARDLFDRALAPVLDEPDRLQHMAISPYTT